MPANIEIKAVLHDPGAAEKTARRLSGGGDPQIIHQVDTFFPCSGARLKLRVFDSQSGELIRYERPNTAEARASRYTIARTPDPENLLAILTATLGTLGTVRKIRHLYRIGQTRVHIDRVENLGDFLEFECVLQPDQEEAEGHRMVRELLREFGIDARQLIAPAYIDLLQGNSAVT